MVPHFAAESCLMPLAGTHKRLHDFTHGGLVATIRQLPSGRWRVEVYRNGMRRGATRDTKAAAKSWGDAMEARLEQGDTGRTFADAAERYERECLPAKRGAKRETYRLRALTGMISGPLAELDASKLSEWREKRLREVSPWSVLRETAILKSLFRIARDEWLWMSHDPFKGVQNPEEPPPRYQRWRWHEVRRILKWLRFQRTKPPETKYQEVALAFAISLATALRASEVLQVGPATLRGRVLILTGTKTEPRAEVPLTRRGARLCALVQRWTIDAASLDALFRKARASCGVKDLRFHDARASALTWMSRKMDVLTLARISRHRDLRVLQRVYYRETAEEIARRLK
jgi:hypothetical protein